MREVKRIIRYQAIKFLIPFHLKLTKMTNETGGEIPENKRFCNDKQTMTGMKSWRWNNTFVLSCSFGTDNDNRLQAILVVACSFFGNNVVPNKRSIYVDNVQISRYTLIKYRFLETLLWIFQLE